MPYDKWKKLIVIQFKIKMHCYPLQKVNRIIKMYFMFYVHVGVGVGFGECDRCVPVPVHVIV